jgi:hypothetical protein
VGRFRTATSWPISAPCSTATRMSIVVAMELFRIAGAPSRAWKTARPSGRRMSRRRMKRRHMRSVSCFTRWHSGSSRDIPAPSGWGHGRLAAHLLQGSSKRREHLSTSCCRLPTDRARARRARRRVGALVVVAQSEDTTVDCGATWRVRPAERRSARGHVTLRGGVRLTAARLTTVGGDRGPHQVLLQL